MTMQIADAFVGLRVIEFAQGVAAPYCGLLLGRNGADVIKVEPPVKGDWCRGLGLRKGDFSSEFIVLNRGKKSLALDMKSPDGRAAAFKLASNADVIIENYRPSVTKRLGVDYAAVAEVNPRVVYASVTGFGRTGPNSEMPATDTVMQGYTGLMNINRDKNGLPRRINMLAIDYSTGLYLSQAVFAALYRRVTTGRGTHIQTSLLDSAMAFQESRLVAEKFEGSAVQPVGAPVGTFATADGYISINARRKPHFIALCHILGVGEWLNDERFNTEENRLVNAEKINSMVAPYIYEKTTAFWTSVLSDADILNAPVQDYNDLFHAPQVLETEAIGWVEIEDFGALPAAHIAGLPPASASDAKSMSPPRLGQGGKTALIGAGFTVDEINQLTSSGAAVFNDDEGI
ncbi:MAG: CaiB/BaiF CoA transferase family protein [Candidatus Puniceispirillaceae bacterium]